MASDAAAAAAADMGGGGVRMGFSASGGLSFDRKRARKRGLRSTLECDQDVFFELPALFYLGRVLFYHYIPRSMSVGIRAVFKALQRPRNKDYPKE